LVLQNNAVDKKPEYVTAPCCELNELQNISVTKVEKKVSF
jgi:hypothetical protein